LILETRFSILGTRIGSLKHLKNPGLLIPGDQAKKSRDVMAVYLLYRRKHLFLLKFRVISPSLTKKIFTLHIAGYNNNLIIWSQWCKKRLVVHLTFQ